MPATAEPYRPHGLREHVHLLEVDQSVEAGLVAFVGKRHVLEEERHERDHRGLELPDAHPVRPVVPARVYHRLELGVQLPELRGEFLPRQREPGDGDVAQAHHDRAEGVQVLVLFAATTSNEIKLIPIIARSFLLCCELDELPQDAHTLTQAGGHADLCCNPKLNLVEASDENVQVGGYLTEMVTTKCVVNQLVLVDTPEN